MTTVSINGALQVQFHSALPNLPIAIEDESQAGHELELGESAGRVLATVAAAFASLYGEPIYSRAVRLWGGVARLERVADKNVVPLIERMAQACLVDWPAHSKVTAKADPERVFRNQEAADIFRLKRALNDKALAELASRVWAMLEEYPFPTQPVPDLEAARRDYDSAINAAREARDTETAESARELESAQRRHRDSSRALRQACRARDASYAADRATKNISFAKRDHSIRARYEADLASCDQASRAQDRAYDLYIGAHERHCQAREEAESRFEQSEAAARETLEHANRRAEAIEAENEQMHDAKITLLSRATVGNWSRQPVDSRGLAQLHFLLTGEWPKLRRLR